MTYPTVGGRTAGFPGSITAGASVGAMNNNTEPGGCIAYAQLTTTTSGFTAGLTGIGALNVGMTPAAARMFKITVQAALFTLGGSGTVTCDFGVYDVTGSTSLASVVISNATAVGVSVPGISVVAYHQPAASVAQNYEAYVQVVAGSGSPTVAVGATAATNAFRGGWIIVEDVGPAF